MAARRKPQAKKVKFELSRSGIAGVGVVCFCIFLWMFLLGVWTGQSLLLPTPKAGKSVVKTTGGPDQPTARVQLIAADLKKKLKNTQ